MECVRRSDAQMLGTAGFTRCCGPARPENGARPVARVTGCTRCKKLDVRCIKRLDRRQRGTSNHQAKESTEMARSRASSSSETYAKRTDLTRQPPHRSDERRYVRPVQAVTGAAFARDEPGWFIGAA